MANYGLSYQARSLAAVPDKEERVRFVVGTLNLREENEIHLIEYDQEADAIRCEATYAHKHEIWDLAPCPYDPTLVFSAYNTGAGGFGASLWRMQPEAAGGAGGGHPPLVHGADLPGLTGALRCVLWSPASRSGAADASVATVEDNAVKLFKVDRGAVAPVATGAAEPARPLSCGAWDPHDGGALAAGAGGAVALWDLRTMTVGTLLEGPLGAAVCDVDFNPQRPHLLVAASDDARLRFWDARAPALPLLELAAHKHWALRVAYNPFHDSLLLSGSSDNSVALWRVTSLAADGPGGPNAEPGSQLLGSQSPSKAAAAKNERGGDGLVQSYDDHHEDSVYGLAWSTVDPWAFASLSHDGRVFVNHVPRSEKYKILI